MKKSVYSKIESYMLSCMKDCAHDKEHVYRVLFLALDIADHEEDVNTDILIASCLLHDIGRGKQFKNHKLSHAKVGKKMAYDFLTENGWPESDAKHIAKCIASHRFRDNSEPESIEAKILFDADKLDITGALGIARTLLYQAEVGEPLYTLDVNGDVLDGTGDEKPSFFKEYNFKLKKIYDRFFTERARIIAKDRQIAAISFYESILKEVRSSYKTGKEELIDKLL